MQRASRVIVLVAVAFVVHQASLIVFAQVPDLINYQGRLVENGALVNGSVALVLRLFNTASGGLPAYEDSNTVTVVDGLYATFIGDDTLSGSLTDALTNAEVWVEAEVDGVKLTPRERLASVAYALSAATPLSYSENGEFGVYAPHAVGTNAIAQGYLSRAAGNYSVVGGGESGVIGADSSHAVIGGGYQNEILLGEHSVIAGGYHNAITGSSAGVVSGGYENQMRNSPNAFLGGGWNNWVSASTNAVLGGGFFNAIVLADEAFIGGGWQNSILPGAGMAAIGGGYRNIIGTNAGDSVIGAGRENVVGERSYASVIGGGGFNTMATGDQYAVIGGGERNALAEGAAHAVVAGGSHNTVGTGSMHAVVGGGTFNKVGNDSAGATIPGGRYNEAGGPDSFAAGQRAKARHEGSFVWADATAEDFVSTGPDQFLVRASGGVGINTNDPGAYALRVAGDVAADSFAGSGAGLTSLDGGALTADSVASNKIDWATMPAGLEDGDDVGLTAEFDPLALHLDGTTPMLGPLDMNGNSIINVADASISFAGGVSFGLPDVLDWGTAYSWGDHAAAGYITGTAASNSFVEKAGDTMTGPLTVSNASPTVLHLWGPYGGGIGYGAVIDFGDLNRVTIDEDADDSLRLYAYGRTAIMGGNVGIGTPAPGQKLSVSGVVESTSGGFKFPDGTTQSTAATGGGNSWATGGNGGLTEGVNFVGTLDAVSLDLRVNDRRGLRIQPVTSGLISDFTPNLLGGGTSNRVGVIGGLGDPVQGAAIGGGGSDTAPNLVADDFGVVGGGEGNTAGLDDGLEGNTHAVVGGGSNNIASGAFSVIPGGADNVASGKYSFAVGHRAKARHPGAMVFADSTEASFSSTGTNQFMVRARGGVGFNAPPPAGDDFYISGDTFRLYAGGAAGSGGKILLGDLERVRLEEDEDDKLLIYGYHRTALMGGNVGVGTTTPSNALEVAGVASASTDLLAGRDVVADRNLNALNDLWVSHDAHLLSNAVVSGNLAASDITASGAFRYVNTRTGYVSVAAAAFMPQDAEINYHFDGRRFWNSANQSGKEFYAPVVLPHGCTMKKMNVYVDWAMSSPTQNVTFVQVELHRAAFLGSDDNLANVQELNVTLTNGHVSVFSDTINSIPVDNQNNEYYLKSHQWISSEFTAIHGVTIEYTYDELAR